MELVSNVRYRQNPEAKEATVPDDDIWSRRASQMFCVQTYFQWY